LALAMYGDNLWTQLDAWMEMNRVGIGIAVKPRWLT